MTIIDFPVLFEKGFPEDVAVRGLRRINVIGPLEQLILIL